MPGAGGLSGMNISVTASGGGPENLREETQCVGGPMTGDPIFLVEAPRPRPRENYCVRGAARPPRQVTRLRSFLIS